MNLDDLRTALAISFSAVLPCPVETVGGAFDGAELRRHVVAAPLVLLALTRVGDLNRHGPAWKASLTLQAYVVTRDTPDLPRERAALDLTGRIIAHAHAIDTLEAPDGSKLFRPGAAPSTLSADNLYSGSIDSVAVALWGVRWQVAALLV